MRKIILFLAFSFGLSQFPDNLNCSISTPVTLPSLPGQKFFILDDTMMNCQSQILYQNLAYTASSATCTQQAVDNFACSMTLTYTEPDDGSKQTCSITGKCLQNCKLSGICQSNLDFSATLNCISQGNCQLTDVAYDQINDKTQPFYSYCYRAIGYNISVDVFQDRYQRGKNAFNMYQAMLAKYNNPNDPLQPQKNCMSILRLFFCGIQFPQYDTSNNISVGGNTTQTVQMCSYLCNVFVNRCPEQVQMYSDYCSNQFDGFCQFGSIIQIYILLITLVIFII